MIMYIFPVLWQCNLYDAERLKLVKSLRNLKLYLPLNIENILSKPDIAAAKCICKFFEKCKLSV